METMTFSERLVRCLAGRQPDRPPFWLVDPPDTFLCQWRKQGMRGEDWGEVCRNFGCDLPPRSVHVSCGPWPSLELAPPDTGHPNLFIDAWGARLMGSDNWQHCRIAEYPVRSRADWEEYKRRFMDADDPSRFAADWQSDMQQCMVRGQPISFGEGKELCLLDAVAHMVGPGTCASAARHEPEMVADMLDHISQMYVKILDKVISTGVTVDMLRLADSNHFLLGEPEDFRRLCGEPLARLLAFARSRSIPLLACDARELLPDRTFLPIMTDMGINCLLEVSAEDVEPLRAKYPHMGLTGGIDLADLKGGRASIDACLTRIEHWIAAGRYVPDIEQIPCLTWPDFDYFACRLRALLGGSTTPE